MGGISLQQAQTVLQAALAKVEEIAVPMNVATVDADIISNTFTSPSTPALPAVLARPRSARAKATRISLCRPRGSKEILVRATA